MTGVDRRILLAWTVLLVLSLVGFTMPIAFMLLIAMVVTIPLAFLLAVTPAIFLYFTATLLVFFPLRAILGRTGRLPLIAGGLAIASSIVLGYGGAALLNHYNDDRVRAWMADDVGMPPLLGRRQGIALLGTLGDTDGRCWGDCQRLLFRGLTPFVLVGKPEVLAAARQGKPARVMRHSIVPASRGCGPVFLQAEPLSVQEWGRAPDAPNVWDYQDILGDRGLCLRSEWVSDPRAEAYLINTLHPPRYDALQDKRRFALYPNLTALRHEVLIRRDRRWTRLFRQTRLYSRRIFSPLLLMPPLGLSTYTPGGFAAGEAVTLGQATGSGAPLSSFIKDDLLLPELAARIRRLDGSQ